MSRDQRSQVSVLPERPRQLQRGMAEPTPNLFRRTVSSDAIDNLVRSLSISGTNIQGAPATPPKLEWTLLFGSDG